MRGALGMVVVLAASACTPDIVGRYFGESDYTLGVETQNGTAAPTTQDSEGKEDMRVEIRNGSSPGTVVMGLFESVCWVKFSGFGSSWSLADKQECTVEIDTTNTSELGTRTSSNVKYTYTFKEGELTQSGTGLKMSLKMELDTDEADTTGTITTRGSVFYDYKLDFDGEKIADE